MPYRQRQAAQEACSLSTIQRARESYLGYSYGTYLGAVYTQMFPGRAGRIVLDSAINLARPGVAKGSNGPALALVAA